MSGNETIAVVGATGRVGHHVVDVLTERGHDVVPISRTHGVDVITGQGLAEALTGVECIVDTATGPSPEQQAATEFFTTAAENLQQVGQQTGVDRIVVRSDAATRPATLVARVEYGALPRDGPVHIQGSLVLVSTSTRVGSGAKETRAGDRDFGAPRPSTSSSFAELRRDIVPRHDVTRPLQEGSADEVRQLDGFRGVATYPARSESRLAPLRRARPLGARTAGRWARLGP